jgi:hypothetical protein
MERPFFPFKSNNKNFKIYVAKVNIPKLMFLKKFGQNVDLNPEKRPNLQRRRKFEIFWFVLFLAP